jgi:acylpyruvate hydrolase
MTLWCVGRNYRDHAKELNNPIPQKPLIFIKAGSCLVHGPQITLPPWAGEIHHECELAVQLNTNLVPYKLALALDLTARRLQEELKSKGEPWTLAKSFLGACPISHAIEMPSDFTSLHFEFYKNSQKVQNGVVSDMLFPLQDLMKYLKSHFPLAPGDWVLTGTPAGVGPLKSGDLLKAQIPGRLVAEWSVL